MQTNKPQTLQHTMREHLLGLLRAYATIVFLDNALAGLFILVVTLLFPNLGLSGLLAASVGLLTASVLRFPQLSSGIHVYNSLLVGLSLGAFYQFNLQLVLLVVVGAILAVFFTAIFSRILWVQDRLPILSVPFVLTALMLAYAARGFDNLLYTAPLESLSSGWLGLQWLLGTEWAGLGVLDMQWLGSGAAKFFATLGAIFFMSYPLIGLVIFAIIVLHSRYLALLAICGYLVGYALLKFLVGELPFHQIAWSGFNFSLTSMAIGGFFTIPSRISFILALLAAAISAVIATALQVLLIGYGLPVLAFPFVITSLTVLAALKQRVGVSQPFIATTPDLPENNYERARLAKVRTGDIGSIAMLPPFMGEWDVYQGFNGEHTHKGAWQHALDFYIREDDKSFAGNGGALSDFYCYGLPVLSPVYGTVVRIEQSFVDNQPGEMDTKNNWGNILLIHLDTGDYVLLAHLKQNSIKVKEKQRVEPGDVVAECGNSGRSPQPHLHLQLQEQAELGSPTKPFQLASVVRRGKDQVPHYQLICVPDRGDRIEAARPEETLAANLHLPVGRCLEYSISINGEPVAGKIRFLVEVTLGGEYRFVSNSGASAALTEINGVLAFYDRKGPADLALDAWLLAMGLTPLTDRAQRWRDEPSSKLLPMGILQRLIMAVRYPMGTGLQSSYTRHHDSNSGEWRQVSTHTLDILGGVQAQAEAIFDVGIGCVRFSLNTPRINLRAELASVGLIADEGIPGWTEAVGHESAQ